MIRRLSFLCAAVLSFACGPTSIDGDLDIADQELGVVKVCSSFSTPQTCNARAKRCEWVGASCPEPLPPGAKSCLSFGQCVNIKPVVMDGGTGTADAGTVVSVCKAGEVLVSQIGGPDLPSPGPSPICVAVDPKCTAVSKCSCLPAAQGTCYPTSQSSTTPAKSDCTCDNGIR